MTKRRIDTLRSLAGPILQAVAVISIVRKVGPRRIGRIAALATAGYLAKTGRGRGPRGN